MTNTTSSLNELLAAAAFHLQADGVLDRALLSNAIWAAQKASRHPSTPDSGLLIENLKAARIAAAHPREEAFNRGLDKAIAIVKQFMKGSPDDI